jgi:anhydro-N-acetylmuramic acid kinase
MVYPVIGLMSGTSLDGLDVVLCEFTQTGTSWSYDIVHGETVQFPDGMADELRAAHALPPEQLLILDRRFSVWCGELLRDMKRTFHFNVVCVGSHGHTVFHHPAAGYTLQIGNGEVIAKTAGIPVVSDFRSGDIALGGQGAPLVPAGERLLFPEYSMCLNLGGIANISLHAGDRTIAFDVCPANQLLNHLAHRMDKEYDPNGSMATSGKLREMVLANLNQISYYSSGPPKSLSREMVESSWFPLLPDTESTEDLLHTCCKHIADQVGQVLHEKTGKPLLVTGGGAFNKQLLADLEAHLPCTIHLPSEMVINYKEALIFGFLGLLRWLGLPNVLSSVTGASRDHCSGTISIP